MDISKLSVSELRDLLQKIPAEIKRREAQEKVNILNEVKAFAKAKGYALEDLVGKEVKAIKASRGPVKAKYRNPKDASQEWTGRGRKPKWVEAWIAGGGKLDAIAING